MKVGEYAVSNNPVGVCWFKVCCNSVGHVECFIGDDFVVELDVPFHDVDATVWWLHSVECEAVEVVDFDDELIRGFVFCYVVVFDVHGVKALFSIEESWRVVVNVFVWIRGW